jgi:Na+/H+ antiporter NhaC
MTSESTTPSRDSEIADVSPLLHARSRARVFFASLPWRGPARLRVLGASLLALLLVGAWTAVGPALAPPLVALLLAVATRRLVPSLIAGALVGAVLLHGPLRALPAFGAEHVASKLTSPWHLQVLGFTCLLLGLVQVTNASGGTRAVVDRLCAWVRSARSAQLATVLMGCVVFFDDYANCMLVGPTMRPLVDRYRISREKLAFLVDSTAAPVAGLVLLSTWVGYEAGLLEEASRDLALGVSGYALLYTALPFRFYCIFALVSAFSSAGWGRDFGPMLGAEERARAEAPAAGAAEPVATSGGTPEAEPAHTGDGLGVPDERRRARHAVLPLLALVLMALAGFVVDGGGAVVLRERPLALFELSFWSQSLTESKDHAGVLFRASVVGAAVALVLPVVERVLSLRATLRAFFSGARAAAYAVGVLLSAWSLTGVCKDLGTGATLVALVGGELPDVLIPAVTFLLASGVAMATGSAFGTMALLIPVSLPLAHAGHSEVLVALTAASVLDGAIFGDHCSPISDTTVMASIAAGSDHMSHVSTQLPYALVAMFLALGVGYLPVALGAPLWASYAVGTGALLLLFRLKGRVPRAPA